MSRPTWQQYFLDFAWVASRRGTCRVQVGAIATRQNRLLLSGYAGSIAGDPHCCDIGCYWTWVADNVILPPFTEDDGSPGPFSRHCQRTIHAEANVVSIAGAEGIALRGTDWYTYPFGPCDVCAKLLISSGARSVTYPEPPPGFMHYRNSPLLVRHGVEVNIVSPFDWQPPS